MEWLTPGAFWLLPLIALLFFFARRRNLEQRWVGNLYLWASSAPPDPSQLAVRRLRRHWLIALQAGVMLAAILALAHPVISSTAHRVAFIIDISASMGARDGAGTRLSLARQQAALSAAALPRGTRVRMVAAGPVPIDRGEFSARGSDLDAAIAALTPTDGSAAIADAINAARAREGAGADVYVYVFTDQPAPAAMATAPARWVRVAHAADNLAITALSMARLPADPSSVQALITVHNFGAAARVSGLDVLRGAAVIDHESIAVPAESAASVTVAFTAAREDAPSVIEAKLTTTDALAADNVRWAIVPAAAPLRVRLLTHGSPFLARALTANHALAVQVLEPADLDAAAVDAHGADVLVCDGCRAMPAAPAALVIPPAPSDAPPTLSSLALAGPAHPVTNGIDFTGLAARQVPRVAGAVDGERIARVGDGSAIVVSDLDGRRLVELNIDLSSSTLPLSVSFPLLVANAIDWLSARSDQLAPAIAGDPLVWALADSPTGASATGPDGRAVPVHTAGRVVSVTDTLAAGVYRIHAGSADRAFAVNTATGTESNLSMAQRGTELTLPVSAPAATSTGSDSVAGTTTLLIVALLLLALEWRQFCRGAR